MTARKGEGRRLAERNRVCSSARYMFSGTVAILFFLDRAVGESRAGHPMQPHRGVAQDRVEHAEALKTGAPELERGCGAGSVFASLRRDMCRLSGRKCEPPGRSDLPPLLRTRAICVICGPHSPEHRNTGDGKGMRTGSVIASLRRDPCALCD